jgi:hypothetical protein
MRTDRHDGANSRFLQFSERAKNCYRLASVENRFYSSRECDLSLCLNNLDHVPLFDNKIKELFNANQQMHSDSVVVVYTLLYRIYALVLFLVFAMFLKL